MRIIGPNNKEERRNEFKITVTISKYQPFWMLCLLKVTVNNFQLEIVVSGPNLPFKLKKKKSKEEFKNKENM